MFNFSGFTLIGGAYMCGVVYISVLDVVFDVFVFPTYRNQVLFTPYNARPSLLIFGYTRNRYT